EQAMVHAAAGYARMRNRLGALACTSSIGPGATNMVTGAACATINRLPVLLLPGDVFASRRPDPVLQQLEVPWQGDCSFNDCFQPASRSWDRISRPEQLIPAALAAMRVLTNQAETGAVTLALPQDVQAEAYDYPADFFEARVWRVARSLPDEVALDRAAELIRSSQRPLLVAGGGVIYSEATAVLARLAGRSGIPVRGSAGGQRITAVRPPELHGRRRRHRHPGGQPAGGRGRPGDRRRDSLERLHHGVQDGLPSRRRPLHQRERRGVRRAEARRAAAARRRQGDARGARGEARRLGGP